MERKWWRLTMQDNRSGITAESTDARYARQVVLPGIGAAGQRAIRSARVLVAGAGGLGSPAIAYLAMAGVGTLGIADPDRVDPTNLNRQFLHFSDDVGRPKTESASEKVFRLNPDIRVVQIANRLDRHNVGAIIRDYDLIIDATDTPAARFLISDAGYELGLPVIECGVSGYEGLLMTIIPGKTPCYRCLFPDEPPASAVVSGAEAGILGMVAGIFGTLQALEAIKLILRLGEPETGHVLTFDALSSTFRRIPWGRRPDCPLCGATHAPSGQAKGADSP